LLFLSWGWCFFLWVVVQVNPPSLLSFLMTIHSGLEKGWHFLSFASSLSREGDDLFSY
jgi:hypothetical protein